MSSTSQPANYTAYLLRCWQEGTSWRYSLEEVGGGQQSLFIVVLLLVIFTVGCQSAEKEPK